MATGTMTTATPTTLTRREQRALRALRARYQQHQDLFSQRELAHLQFLRWLFQTGRLVP